MKNRIYKRNVIERIKIKNDFLGKNYKIFTLLNIRMFLCIVLFSIFAFLFSIGLVVAPCLVILFYYLSEYFFFDLRIIKRKYKLEREADIFFEMLLISLKSKKNIFQALETITEKTDMELSKEFKKVLKDVQIGVSFKDAIANMKKRIPSDAINTILLSIVEANSNPTLLIETLEAQVNYVSEKIMQDAKCSIHAIPIKMNIVSLLFVLCVCGLLFYVIYLI